ncbi:MAG: thermonuclease family protein [Alphaproteobacteria bacterium]
MPDVGRERDGAAGWPSAWHALLEDGGLEDGGFFYRVGQPAKRDRYGCRLAIVETAEGLSLQQALIEQGWAAVDPLSAPGGSDDIDAMLALESRARQAGRGIWKDRQVRPKKAGELNGLIGTRQLVEGRVLRVFSNDRHVYLNFGADWRTDFTVRLDRKMIEAAAFNAADFDGKLLRIRGVLEEARGPLIAIQHPKQIEFLP